MNYLLVDWENLAEKKIAYKYPNVASEILSNMHESIINFFTSTQMGKTMYHFEQLLEFYASSCNTANASQFNFTRASYVCKILNNLILHKSGLFINHLLSQKSSIHAVLNCCQSKSVSGSLLNIITLIPSAQQSPMAMAGTMGLQDNKTDPNSNPQSEVLKETFSQRLDLFKQTIRLCIETQHDADLNDLHANLANVIMIIINKDFNERTSFMKILLAELPSIIESFAATFDNLTNNKLGNIFLVLLEVLFKENDKDNSLSEIKITSLNSYIALYFKLLKQYYEVSFGKPGSTRMTPSFSKEIERLNPKVYKILEAIIVTLKTQMGNGSFDLNVVYSGGFEECIFKLFEAFPFNNILHNQLKKYLLIILEKTPEDLIRKYFTDNPQFYVFLEKLGRNKYIDSSSSTKVKKGYVGHILTLVTQLKDKPLSITQRIFEGDLIRPGVGNFYGELLYYRARSRVTRIGRYRVSI